MPLLIRELNIKINIEANSERGTEGGASSSSNAGDQKLLTRKLLDELLRIEALKKER